jgi:trehalose/maltose hydrolase-like predicted phosphorylase
MIKHAADIFILALEKAKAEYPEVLESLNKDLSWAYDFAQKLYVPQPGEDGIIEQFDGYLGLEDTTPKMLKERELKENEYWGGHGLASTTRAIKQADVIMALNVFGNEYSREIKKANWDFYEPYTEHGSSLSACAYAIVAAQIGYTDWAYKYFMKTATVDLTGDTKQYIGSQYIGGTHPAANGGAWNTAIFGFAGVSYTDTVLDISPQLPENWKSIEFKLNWQGEKLNIKVIDNSVKIIGAQKSKITVYGREYKYEA